MRFPCDSNQRKKTLRKQVGFKLEGVGMKKIIIDETWSLCPACLKRIPALLVEERGRVYMEKTCPEHGNYKTIIWRDSAESYRRWVEFSGLNQRTSYRSNCQVESERGCPFDCGLCPEHLQDTCSAALMTTNSCNLACSICFTKSKGSYLPSLDEVRAMYEFYRSTFTNHADGAYPVELCGGEPTTRDDLPAIVAMGKEMGFDYIQLNTNGIRLAQDEGYTFRLKEAGVTTIYLNFDGISDKAYEDIAGERLFELKVKALQNCERAELAVILVPLVVPGLNDDQIGAIIRFAKEWIPTVKGVFFQPVSYFGKHHFGKPSDDDRLTIPDLLRCIEAQTCGELMRSDFVPPRCEHPLCSFNGLFFVGQDGRLKATTNFSARQPVHDAAAQIRRFTKKFWSYNKNRYLTVGGMVFQDVWNVDLERLKRCTVHIICKDKKLIPLCAKYLTDAEGRRLYPGIA